MTQLPVTQDDHRPRDQSGAVLPRLGRIGLRMLAAVALIAGSVAFAGFTGNTAAVAADNACDGVIVVVDFTDLGGSIEMVCVDGNPPTGYQALLNAGFTTTDSQPGFICAINSMPDPCPETFDGSFWAYWNATPDGEWVSYQVGADSSTPAHGSIEGWRYNDGATPPWLSPAEVAASLTPSTPDATETPETTPGTDEAVTSSPLADQRAGQTTVLTIVTVSFLALIAAFILFFIVRRRRQGPGAGGAGSTD